MSTFHIPYAKIEVLDCPEYREMEESHFGEMKAYDKNHVNEVEHLVIKDLKMRYEVEVRAVRYYDPPLGEILGLSRILGFIVNITADTWTRKCHIRKEKLEVTSWGAKIVENGEEAVRCYKEWMKEMYVVSPRAIELVPFNKE